jgi:orotate phosphoribosyltransferase
MQDTPATASRRLDARRDRLRQIIEEKSLITGRTFTLASGRTSSFFVNLKQTMLDPEGANLLADLILDIMEERGLRNIGGLEMGAVPLVAAVCTKSFERSPVNAFFVRKGVKDHGAAQLIDGHFQPDAEVLIVDDVVTTGGSAIQAAEVVRARGCHVSKVLAIVDRQEGGRENLADHGFELISLLERRDFPQIGD